MNWLDLVLIIVCCSGFFVGWKIGLFGAIFTTVGLFAGTLFAAQFSDDVADLLTDSVSSDTVATVLAYSVILLAVLIGAQIAKKIAQRIENKQDLFNRNIEYEKVEIDTTFPKYIFDNKIIFKDWII